MFRIFNFGRTGLHSILLQNMLVFSRQVKKCTILHRHRHSLYSMFYTLCRAERYVYERALIETNLLGEHNLISATINQRDRNTFQKSKKYILNQRKTVAEKV